MKFVLTQLGILAALSGALAPVFAQNEIMGMPRNAAERARVLEDKKTLMPNEMNGVGVDEKLGQKVDLDLSFVSEDGRLKKLGDYFKSGRPVVLNLVYFKCPMLCNLTLNAQVTVLKQLAWTPGKEFDVVTISIDPTETSEMAKDKKEAYLSNFDRPVGAGWHFLVDYQGNVKKLADQVGFRYNYDAHQQQYAHSAAIMILTPQGMVSRYLYGIKFKEQDLRLALTEAAADKFGLSFEKILLMCYHYDPSAKSYVLFATNFMRLGGFLVMVTLGFFLFRFWRKDFMTRDNSGGAGTTLAVSNPGGTRN
ncbi:SCO family protein [Bryobacter aggregatus]|uniref:SCO family protein n=1 Tax=Bryobacter aggregatus TaxID=360054 RepID=UPI00068E2243|nr:SCO family protein [Bryobacter aggregatus]